MRVPSKTWEALAERYRSIRTSSPAIAAMRLLCEHVARAPYGGLVYGAKSMHILLVAQHSELEWDCGMLRIEATGDDEISFTLHEQPFVKPVQFRSTPEALISTFEAFLRRMKWVSEDVLPSV